MNNGFDNRCRKDLSKEWAYWRNHYKNKGCGYNKVGILTFRKMRKLHRI